MVRMGSTEKDEENVKSRYELERERAKKGGRGGRKLELSVIKKSKWWKN